MTSVTTAVEERDLTSFDRCDRCGAQAYVQAVLDSTGGELLFCSHHARAVEPTLKPLTTTWNDQTLKLIKDVLRPEK